MKNETAFHAFRISESNLFFDCKPLESFKHEVVLLLLPECGGGDRHGLLRMLHSSAVLSDCLVPLIIQAIDGFSGKYAFSICYDYC